MRVKAAANVYRSLNGAMGSVHSSRDLADQQAGRGRLACIEFEFFLEDGPVGLAAALREMDGVQEP